MTKEVGYLLLLSPFILLLLYLVIDIGFAKVSRSERNYAKRGLVYDNNSHKLIPTEIHGKIISEYRTGRFSGIPLKDYEYFREDK